MEQKLTYKCDSCSRTSRIADGDPIPQCCGKVMTKQKLPLEQCTEPSDAENARFTNDDDACDDNR